MSCMNVVSLAIHRGENHDIANDHGISQAREKDESPRVEPLRAEHFDKVLESIGLAFENDPLQRYLNDTPDTRKPNALLQKLDQYLWKKYMEIAMKRRVSYTVDGGYSVIICSPPVEDVRPPSPIERIIDSTKVKVIMALKLIKWSSEQRRRLKELIEKSKALTDAHIPDGGAKEMICVEVLATHPKFQGKAYASALLDVIIFGADLRARSIYLHTGNPENVGFYEIFGFENAGEVLLGAGNPTWVEPPVPINLMIRKPMVGRAADL